VREDVVCLECGKRVSVGGCACPPPSLHPPSIGAGDGGRVSSIPVASGPISSIPYRVAPDAPVCPRCDHRLHESTVHDALVLDCGTCGGVFVSKRIIEQLDTPEGRYLRVAFPVRPRMPEPPVVRYLVCPLCSGRMNRSNFARGANVIVDLCKEDGIWFDAGEVHAVIDFVEDGGLERAKRRALQDRAAENEKLRSSWRKTHEESVQASTFGRGRVYLSSEERALADAFFSWLWR